MRISDKHKTRDPIARALRAAKFRIQIIDDKRRKQMHRLKHRKGSDE